MWQRIKTAIVLVIIVGVAMFAGNQYLFLSLLGLGVVIASHEWTKLMPQKTDKAYWFVALVFGLTLVSLYVAILGVIWWALSAGLWILAAKWVKDYPTKVQWYDKRLWSIGVVILVASITAMYVLWYFSPWLLLYVFLLVWCADSGAYFVGRKLGKRKLAPNVSPNKSVEGLFGGIITASIVAVGVATFLQLSLLPFLLFSLLSGVVVGVSVLGDLFESMLKRAANVKDSGTILPGHGGVLDRIDSLLSATPIFAIGVLLFEWFGASLVGVK